MSFFVAFAPGTILSSRRSSSAAALQMPAVHLKEGSMGSFSCESANLVSLVVIGFFCFVFCFLPPSRVVLFWRRPSFRWRSGHSDLLAIDVVAKRWKM